MVVSVSLLSKFQYNKYTPFQKKAITGIKNKDSSTNTGFHRVLENRM